MVMDLLLFGTTELVTRNAEYFFVPEGVVLILILPILFKSVTTPK